jgi:hypothetical protein
MFRRRTGETAAQNREQKVFCDFSVCSAAPRESAVLMDPSWFTRSRGVAENQRAQVCWSHRDNLPSENANTS